MATVHPQAVLCLRVAVAYLGLHDLTYHTPSPTNRPCLQGTPYLNGLATNLSTSCLTPPVSTHGEHLRRLLCTYISCLVCCPTKVDYQEVCVYATTKGTARQQKTSETDSLRGDRPSWPFSNAPPPKLARPSCQAGNEDMPGRGGQPKVRVHGGPRGTLPSERRQNGKLKRPRLLHRQLAFLCLIAAFLSLSFPLLHCMLSHSDLPPALVRRSSGPDWEAVAALT